MIQNRFPQYAAKLQYLRDVNPETLGVGEEEIYRIVRSLPVIATRADVLRLLPDSEAEIRQTFRIHDEPPNGYPIRQICLYGITECLRADMVPDCLCRGDIERFGELMNISHDGDRVSRVVDGERVPTDNSYPDERIDALIADLQSGDPERVERARLWRQGGALLWQRPVSWARAWWVPAWAVASWPSCDPNRLSSSSGTWRSNTTSRKTCA